MPLVNRVRAPSVPADGTGPRILFVHIPKTAGMSLYHALEGWASPRRSMRFGQGGPMDLGAYLALPEDRLRELRVLSGHLPLRDFRQRDLTGWSMVTLLRDPVARTLSTYSFIRGNPNHPWHAEIAPMPLADFVDWFEARPANHDQQCGFISRERTAESAFRVLSDEFLLCAAIEHLGEFAAALSHVLGTTIGIAVRNRSRHVIDRSTVGSATLERIRDMQREDDALYQRVLRHGLVGSATQAR